MSSSRNSPIRAPPSSPVIRVTLPGTPTFSAIRLTMSPTTVVPKGTCPRKKGKSKC